MLSPQADVRIFKEHIEATVELRILRTYVDYFTSAIIEAAPTPSQVGLTTIRRPPILSLEARDLLSQKNASEGYTSRQEIQQYSSTTNRLCRPLANNRKANQK